MLMATVIATSMAACGDKETEAKAPTSSQAEQGSEQETSGEETATEDSETESMGSDNIDMPNATGDEDAGTVSESEGFDWASVNWLDMEYTTGFYKGQLLDLAKAAMRAGKTKEDVIEKIGLSLSSYENWGDFKVLLDELMKLSKDELIFVEETYRYADEKAGVETKCKDFDWSSVEWNREVSVGDPPQTKTLGQIAMDVKWMRYSTYADVATNELAEIETVEEAMNGNSSWAEAYRRAGITYDNLDDDVKIILNELFKLSSSKGEYVFTRYKFWQDADTFWQDTDL